MDKVEAPRKVFKVPAENVDLLRTQVDVVNKRVARALPRDSRQRHHCPIIPTAAQ